MISIVIPTYNAESFIKETIESVLKQTHTEWELIIIDDGSTDSTADIIQEYVEKDSRIKYYYQTNAGVSTARNKGINLSKGKYIAFLDADDIWLPNNLKEKVKILESDSDVYWVFSNIIYFYNDTEIIEKLTEGFSKGKWLDSILSWQGVVKTNPSNIIIRRECCYTKGILFDEQLSTAADKYFCIQLANSFKGAFINKPLVRYRVVDGSMSKNINAMEADELLLYKKSVINGYFKNKMFQRFCYSKMYWILGGSWWKDGKNKKRGLFFLSKALFSNPFIILWFIKRKITTAE